MLIENKEEHPEYICKCSKERMEQAENSFFFEIRVLAKDCDLKDPEAKTNFHREIAKKLCGFSEELERENYLEAIAEKYHIGFDNLRKLVNTYAQQTGLAKPVERPKSGVQPKNAPEEKGKKAQRLLITLITDEPQVYTKIKSYITQEDFTDELYRKVAERLFADLEQGTYNPAAIISMFTDEEEQRVAASLFNTNLPELTTKQEKEKAFHDIVYAVKKNSYEYFTTQLGADVTALNKVIAGKKALEELAKTHISLD